MSIEARGDAIVVRKAPDLMALKGFLGKRLPPAEERRKMIDEVVSRRRPRR